MLIFELILSVPWLARSLYFSHSSPEPSYPLRIIRCNGFPMRTTKGSGSPLTGLTIQNGNWALQGCPQFHRLVIPPCVMTFPDRRCVLQIPVFNKHQTPINLYILHRQNLCLLFLLISAYSNNQAVVETLVHPQNIWLSTSHHHV